MAFRLKWYPLLVAFGLAACGNPTLESTFKPQVTVSQLAYDVRFGPGDTLAPADAAAVDGFLQAQNVQYGDRLAIDDPVESGRSQRRAAIAGVVARFGMLIEETPAVPTSPPLQPGMVRLVVSRATAERPNCPDWHRKAGEGMATNTSSNYGCAVVSNLNAMIADPNDLVTGKTYRGPDGEIISKAVKVWRDHKPSGVDKELPTATSNNK